MPPAQSVSQLVVETQNQLLQDFPHLQPLLKSVLAERFSVVPQTQSTLQTVRTPTLTTEEYQEVVQKLQQISQLPGSTIENETLLYIEQQLSDVLGFEVTTGTDQFQLLFQKARIMSSPELFSSPTLKRGESKSIPEAGQSQVRSIFGWQLSTTPQKSLVQVTEYWIALPIRSLVNQPLSNTQLRQLLMKKKFCLINPQQELFCIAQLLDDYLDPANRCQLGGSPRLIREGQFWSPSNLGKTLVFYLEDQSNNLQPGCYRLRQH